MTAEPEEVNCEYKSYPNICHNPSVIAAQVLSSAGQCWSPLNHELSVPGVRAVQLLDIKTVLLTTLHASDQ